LFVSGSVTMAVRRQERWVNSMAKHGFSVSLGIDEYRYRATILDIVDGDTFDAMVDLGFESFQRKRFRVYGIDTPERGSDKWAAARADLQKLLLRGNNLRIATFKDRRDKYGRYVADVVILDRHGYPAWLSDEMLKLGNAVEYMQ